MDGNQFVHHCCCYCYLSFDFVIFVIISWTLLHSPLLQKKRFYQSSKQARGALDVILPHVTLLPFPNFPPHSILPHKSVKLLQSFAWMEHKTKIVKRSGFSEKKKLGFCLWYMHAQRRGLRDVIFCLLPPSPHPPPPKSIINVPTMMNPKQRLRRRLMIIKKPKLLSLQTPNQMQKRKKKR